MSKCNVIIVILLLNGNLLFSQKIDTIYFDLDWQQCSKELASFYRIRKVDVNYTGQQEDYYITGEKQQIVSLKNGSKTGSSIYWYRNGQKSAIGNYKMGQIDGLFTNFYLNGQKSGEHNYVAGEYHGNYTLWYPNGKIKEEGIYENGNRKEDFKLYDENGIRYYLFYKVDKKPLFLKTNDDLKSSIDLNNYILSKIKEIKYIKEKQLVGKVLVGFIVNEEGNVESVSVSEGVNHYLDIEAKKIIENLPKFKPGVQGGNNVKVKISQPVIFTL
ncbi:MAG: TonB family protein [Bacteroidia bacterium]|nr:TonB family protein [Bacteroidia bacterium]